MSEKNKIDVTKPIHVRDSIRKFTHRPDMAVYEDGEKGLWMVRLFDGGADYASPMRFSSYTARNIPEPRVIPYTPETFDWSRIGQTPVYGNPAGASGPIKAIGADRMYITEETYINFSDGVEWKWPDGSPCGVVVTD